MGVRNCAEIGENLQKIVTRLMANADLVNVLYYIIDRMYITAYDAVADDKNQYRQSG